MTCTHKLLKATGAPAALLPFLPQPSEQQLFFCSVVCRCLTGEGGQGGAAGWGAEPQAEQPAAAGGVTEHGGPSHQSHRAAVQRQQALLASPPHVRARTEISRVMQIVQCGFFLRSTHLLCSDIFWKHTHIPILFNLTVSCPESWTCLLVREYANQFLGGKKDIYHPVMTFADWPTQAAVLMCYARVLLVVCVCMYDSVCVDVCASIYCFKYLTSWA